MFRNPSSEKISYRSKQGENLALSYLGYLSPQGALLDLAFKPIFPTNLYSNRPPGMWRYREALPLDQDALPVSFTEGFTPLLPVSVHGHQVLVKQEQFFPSGSYKDRGASMLISHAKSQGINRVVEDSSGNAGAALAAYCARAEIECLIYVPADTSPGKLAQIRSYGAELVLIPGDRDATAQAVLQAAEHTYYASHSYNPFFFHGTKTFAFELWEQLGFQAPDVVVLPAGNGTLLLGVAIGFEELYQAGMIPSLPQIYGVQAANCAPLVKAWNQGKAYEDSLDGITSTIAEGIAIPRPIRGQDILDVISKTKGGMIAVTEDEIYSTHRSMSHMGFCIEPTSAATIAGIAYLPKSYRDKRVVSLFSGHGLKAPNKLPG